MYLRFLKCQLKCARNFLPNDNKKECTCKEQRAIRHRQKFTVKALLYTIQPIRDENYWSNDQFSTFRI